MRKAFILATGCALLALTAGCGAAVNSDTRTEGPTLAPKTPEEQLSIMVLPLKEFGDAYSHFDTDDDSGYTDGTEAADNTILLGDTAADVVARGYVAGYDLSFSNDTILTHGMTGTFEIDSNVEMFTDEVAAAAFMAKEIGDSQAVVGQDIGDGLVLTELTLFEVTDLGDEAVGVHASFALSGMNLYTTVVWFRSGSYLGDIELFGTNKGGEAEAATTIKWAHKLLDRMDDVRDGSLNEEPALIPTAAPTDTPAPVATAAP